MKIIKALLWIVGLLYVQGLQLKYELWKSYIGDVSNQYSVKLGQIRIEKNQQYKQIKGVFAPLFPTLVTHEDFKSGAVILSFKGTQNDKRIFLTSVVESIKSPHSQKIVVVVDTSLNIKAINYIQQKEEKLSKIKNKDLSQEIDVEISMMQTARQYILKIQPPVTSEAKKEEESFFSKYKWPIIIVGAMMFLSSSMGGGDRGPQQAPATQ